MKGEVLQWVVWVALFSGCTSLKPFTEKLRDSKGWDNETLKKIQFYASHDIVLQRKLSSNNTSIVKGKIKVVNGEQVEEILIRSGTPGVLEFSPGDNRVGISFEEGDERYLMFGPNPSKAGKFYILASDWKNGIGKVTYEGESYFLSPESGKSYLMVDMKEEVKKQVETRTAGGRKVD